MDSMVPWANNITSLQSGMGFTSNQAILLSAPVSPVHGSLRSFIACADSTKPYYYAVIPVIISSRIGDSESPSLPTALFGYIDDTHR